MAIMIPTDSYFDQASGEKHMFDALKQLPDDYYVFHSYRLVQLIPDKGLNENEIDFLIFNPNYGCLFIECKNSRIKRESDGQWKYVKNENGNIKEINMKDPFNQAFTGQHNLFNKLRETYPEYKSIIDKCKFLVSIWLPKYTKEELRELDLGSNVAKEIILTREALLYPKETLAQVQFIMERMNKVHLVCKYEEELLIENSPGYKHKLSYNDAMFFYNRILCPTFRTIVNIRKDYEDTYIELLDEQYIILEFLTHQRTAAISGGSGTGKTLVAVERARRLSQKGDKVLFLCFNKNLSDWLEKSFKKELSNVDFYTLSSFGCKKCSTTYDKLSFYDLKDVLESEILEHKFPYKHVIIDEGQDFGKDNIDESEILELFASYGAGEFDDEDTSFFIFYDKNQLVNSKKIPLYLQNVDSKLTLYRNCRNTKNIASTAYSLLDCNPILYEKAWDGDVARFIFYSGRDEFYKRLNNLVEELAKDSLSERVIISCSDSLSYSVLNENLISENNNRLSYYKTGSIRTRVFTCPTFKGLESDDVILIDIGNNIFDQDNKSFYVAASRAKKRLFVFIDTDKINVDEIINTRFKETFPMKDRYKQLASVMHGLIK